jgi:CSLREA domain-containing protein
VGRTASPARLRVKWISIGLGGALLVLTALPAVAGAATIQVGTTADQLDAAAPCSLREAVQSIDQGSLVIGCANLGPVFGTSDAITIPAGTYQLTIPSTNEDANVNGDLDITKPVAISGAGAGPGGTMIDATHIDRAIDVISSGTQNTLQVSGVLIENGSTVSDGGAIRNSDMDSTTTVQTSTLVGNHADGVGGAIALPGGAAANTGLQVQFTEFSGNTAGDDGGAIFRGPNNGGTLAQIFESLFDHNTSGAAGGAVYQQGLIFEANGAIYRNSTFDNNSATEGGGAIALGTAGATASLNFVTFGGNATSTAGHGGALFGDAQDPGQAFGMHGTVFGGNLAGGVDSSCGVGVGSPVTFSDAHYNVESANSCHLITASPSNSLVNTNPLLAPLADNGGQTLTRGLYDTSPAIDRVPSGAECTAATAVDQRGVGRPVGTACDAGAFEGSVGPVPPPPPTGGGAGGGGAPSGLTVTPFFPTTKKCKKKKAHKGAVAAKKKCRKKK